MANKVNEYRLGELFCGPGGIAWGALQARSGKENSHVVHAWANDYDADTCRTYTRNICPDMPESVICSDVRDLDIASLPPIDAFAYGFPCNSFSGVGKHQGLANEKFGQLYKYGIEVMKTHHPLWFIAENVSGIRSAGSGDFKKILEDMREAGYKLTVNLYKAEEYGVPQTRHRVIIVGISNDVKDVEFKVPAPTNQAGNYKSVGEALADIPEGAPNSLARPMQKKVVERLSYIQPGENVWQAEARNPDFPEELKIHTKTRISQIYRKLDPSKPAYTVTAAGGGGTFMYHWKENRELTNRERARIQTFPNDYKFYPDDGEKYNAKAYNSVRKQIGMAVPCELARIIVQAVLDSFNHIDYPSVEPNLKE